MANRSADPNIAGESLVLFVIIPFMLIGFWFLYRAIIVFPTYWIFYLQYRILATFHLLNDSGEIFYIHVQTVIHGDIPYSSVQWAWWESTVSDISRRYILFYFLTALYCMRKVLHKAMLPQFKRFFTLTGQKEGTTYRIFGLKVMDPLLVKILGADFSISFVRGIITVLLWACGLKFFMSRQKEWVPNGTSLIRYQAKFWKVTVPSLLFNPDTDTEAGKPARRPLYFLRDNGIKVSKGKVVERDVLKDIFVKQLGDQNKPIRDLPLYKQALMLAGCLNLLNGTSEYPQFQGKVNGLLSSLAYEYGYKKIGYEKRIRKLVSKYLDIRLLEYNINKYSARFAYENVAVMAWIGRGGPFEAWGGGDSGIIATASFRWLKGMDRSLWYGLNNIGRNSFHIEGAGIVSHFFSEYCTPDGKPHRQLEPQVEAAIDAVDMYLDKKNIPDSETYFKTRDKKVFDF